MMGSQLFHYTNLGKKGVMGRTLICHQVFVGLEIQEPKANDRRVSSTFVEQQMYPTNVEQCITYC